jgi:formylglycine-generating enzyme required for sulfatase activity
MRLSGLDEQAADPSRGGLTLESLYVSLDTTTQVEEKKKGKARDSSPTIDTFLERERSHPLAALEALAQAPQRRMVLLGLPGTGKSTFVRYLALRMAQAICDHSLTLENLLPGWQGGVVLPVIVSLGRLAESLPPDSRVGDAGMVERFLTGALESDPRIASFAPYLLPVLEREGGLVLFDGLDEVADLGLRPVVVRAMESFVEHYSRNRASRFLVTCRTYSYYHDARWQLTGWPTYELALLDRTKIEHFVDAWHDEHIRIDPARQADYERKRHKLHASLQPGDRRRLSEIAPFPIILTMMAVVHTHYGELPDTRAQVYEKCVDLLLVRWELERPLVSGKLQKRGLLDALGVLRGTLDSALREIAFKAHEGRAEGREEVGGAALVTEDLLSGVLQVYFQDQQKVKTFLDYCQSSNGLLMLQGTVTPSGASPNALPRRVYAFPHLTFEEYLAGRHLEGPGLGRRMRDLLDLSDRWREVAVLLGEYLCFERQDQERLQSILDALAPDPLPGDAAMQTKDWRALWLAGDLLSLYRRVSHWKKSTADDRIVTGLSRLVAAGALDVRERAAAADALDELGWTPDDLYRFVLVDPGDPVASAIQTSLARPDYSFYISLHPVTNMQYERFVKAHDFADPDLWRGFPKFDENSRSMSGDWGDEGWKWLKDRFEKQDRPIDGEHVFPLYWNDPRFGVARRGVPVVGVTWYEANAYCRWLSKHWDDPEMLESRANPDLRPRLARLPTEAEWVLAAGGDQPDDRYPWDEVGKDVKNRALEEILQRANVAKSGIGRTTPAGMYPLGCSQPYKLLDMAGNVWEWQANYRDKDHDWLALRGGSWDNR